MAWSAVVKSNEVKLGGRGYSRLPGGDLQVLGGQPDGSLDSEVLVLGPVDEVGRDYSTQIIHPDNQSHQSPHPPN
jgi:hypothetical protein